MTTLPDLDNDTLKYTFRKQDPTSYKIVYNIWRSINGRPEQKIGTVVKTRDGDWSQSAHWVAESSDGEHRGSGDTRQSAVRSLENRLQGPEYTERKLQAYRDQLAAEGAKAAAAKAADEDLIDALMARWPAIAERLLPLRENAGRFTSYAVTTQQVIDMLNALETS